MNGHCDIGRSFWIRCSGWFRVFLVRATSDSLSRKGEKTQGSSRIGTLSGPGPRLLMLWHLCERESVEDTLTTSPSYRPTDVVNDSNASPCSSSTAGKRTRLSAPPEKTLMNPDEPGTSMSSWNLRLWLLCQWQLWKALPLTPFVTTFASLATLLVKLAPVVMSP